MASIAIITKNNTERTPDAISACVLVIVSPSICDRERIRTPDSPFRRRQLFPLSYAALLLHAQFLCPQPGHRPCLTLSTILVFAGVSGHIGSHKVLPQLTHMS